MAKDARKLVESKVGSLQDVKAKATDVASDAAGKAKDAASGSTDKLAKYAAAIPGLGGLGKVCFFRRKIASWC